MKSGHLIGKLLRRVRAGERFLAWNDSAVLGAPESIVVTSVDFADRGTMPRRFAGPGVGENVSPALAWKGIPSAAVEIVLVMEDASVPFRRPFVHMIARGIDPRPGALPQGALSPAEAERRGIVLGRGTMGGQGYSGPRALPGHGPHEYHFQLFALSRRIESRRPLGRDELLAAVKSAVIARGRIVGLFEQP